MSFLSPSLPVFKSSSDLSPFNLDSPTEERMPRANCECLCHSRKVSMCMLDLLDKQNKVMENAITSLDLMIQKVKQIKPISGDNFEMLAKKIVVEHKKKENI